MTHPTLCLHRLASLSLACLTLTGSLLGLSVQSATAASCIVPLGSSQASRVQTVQAAYEQWKEIYVTADGVGGALRVQRSSFDGYDTVSEGIAYGMLFAAYMAQYRAARYILTN